MKKAKILLVFVAMNYGCNSATNEQQYLPEQTFLDSSADAKLNQFVRQDSIKNIRQQMIDEMRNLPMTGRADKDYADLMIVHHKTTQRLAGFEYARGEHLTVAQIAERIASKDNKEMLNLKKLSLQSKQTERVDSFKVEVSAFIKSMSDTVPSQGPVDNRFIELMTEHEQTAIDISEIYLKYAYDPKLKVVARNIILNNQKEIPKLKAIKPH